MAEFTKIFTNNSQFKLILTYSHSQNITNNTTTVKATLKVQSMAYGVASGWTNKSAGISINGNNVTYTFNPNMGANRTKTIATRSYTFSHNADGKKSVNISANANYTGVTWNGGGLGNVTLGGTVSLPTIPRASTISSISGGTLGSTLTVNITRASSSFTHRVGYYRTDGSRTMDIIGNVATSTSFTLPLSDASLLPSATTGTAKIIVDTYNGSTRIGSASKTFKVTVPSSVVPSITSFNLNENIAATKAIGLAANTFVKNKSQISMTASADGSYNSTIRDYTFSFNGASQGGTVGRQFNVGNITGNHTAKVVVKDSRGRTAERTITAVILDYSPPKINAFRTWRDGTNVVKAEVNCSISILSGKGGAWYVDSGGASWTNRNSGSLTSTASSYKSNITIVGTYPDSSSATFRLRVNDAFGAGPTAASSVSTSKTALSLYKDVGIGVGKRWERGTLDVGGDTHINGNLFIDGTASRLKGTINWTVPNANAIGVFTHLYRNNGKMLSALYHSTADDTLGMNMYDQNGSYKINKFLPDGGVNFAGRIWSGSYITATGDINTTNGIILENGKRVATKTHQEGSLTFPDKNFSPYNATYSAAQHPKVYTRDGSIVTISGAIKNNVVVASGWSGDIAQLPSWAPLPRNEVNAIAQGSYNSTFLITIRTTGRIGMTRYRNGDTSVATPVGSWLNVSFTYASNLG